MIWYYIIASLLPCWKFKYKNLNKLQATNQNINRIQNSIEAFKLLHINAHPLRQKQFRIQNRLHSKKSSCFILNWDFPKSTVQTAISPNQISHAQSIPEPWMVDRWWMKRFRALIFNLWLVRMKNKMKTKE